MFLKNASRIFNTVTFRLTFWYVILFTILSIVVFCIIYTTLTRSLTMRMDESLANEIVEFEITYKSRGIDGLKHQIELEVESEGTNRIFIRMLNQRREVVETSDMSAWGNIQPPQGTENLPLGQAVFETQEIPGSEHHVRVISKKLPQGNILQVGSTMHDDEELMEVFNRVSAIAVFVLLVCCSAMGWFMGRRAMSGVKRVTKTAAGIGKGDLVSRVPLGGEGEEINNLANAFNDMLERIQDVVTEVKDVTNNIAHDLRSPITRIRGIAETTMTGEQNINDYREMAEIVVEECDRLVGMINVMLEIAMTEAGVREMARDDVDMNRLVESAYEVFLSIAEDKGVLLQKNIPPEPVTIQGDLSQLQRMISNLLDNAVKFTPHGGNVTLSLEASDSRAIITVADTGIGITEQDMPRIFERFYRGDRSRSTPGNGLGLSHVQAIVHAHGGDIKVESNPSKDSVFTIAFPSTYTRH